MTHLRIVLLVVTLLGVFALLGLGGMIWLIDHDVDAELIAIIAGPTGTALGALGTLLASTRTEPAVPAPVQVVNEPANPVPVEPA